VHTNGLQPDEHNSAYLYSHLSMVIQLVTKVTYLLMNLHFSSSTSVCLCPIHFTLLDLTTVTIIGEKFKLSALHYIMFSFTITFYAFHPRFIICSQIYRIYVLRLDRKTKFNVWQK